MSFSFVSMRSAALVLIMAMVITLPTNAAVIYEKDDTKLEVSGDIRVRTEGQYNDDFRSDVNADQTFTGVRSRINLNWSLADHVGVSFKIQDTRRFGDEGTVAGATAGTTNPATYVKEGYFTWDNIYGSSIGIKVGRQDLKLADQRLIGPVGWSNTGRAFDAFKIHGKITEDIPWWAFSSVTTSPALGDGYSNDQVFHGLVVSPKTSFFSSLDLYALALIDNRNLGTGGGDQAFYTFGGDFTLPITDGFDWDLQLNVQNGDDGVNDVSAWSGHTGLKYTMGKGQLLNAVWAEYNIASGDGNTTDQKTETFNNLFPTNHGKYGYADHVGFRNIKEIKVGAGGNLGEKVGWKVNGHFFNLAEALDDFYTVGGGARGLLGAGGTDMGTEIDLVLKYKPVPKLALEAGYSRFLTGSDLDARIRAAGGTPTDADFAYVSSMVKF